MMKVINSNDNKVMARESGGGEEGEERGRRESEMDWPTEWTNKWPLCYLGFLNITNVCRGAVIISS